MRPLTKGEIALAYPVFGELLDYDRVRIVNYPYVPWQSLDVLIAPNGFIFVGDRHYRGDYSAESLSYQTLLIHELTHVLQYQQGVGVLWRGAILQSLYYLSFYKYNII